MSKNIPKTKASSRKRTNQKITPQKVTHNPTPFKKHTKVLCTIGPSTDTVAQLQRMYKAGMNAVRINTAHTDVSQVTKLIRTVRKAVNVPIVVDIKGPELRIHSNAKYTFSKGDTFVIGFAKNAPISLNYNLKSAVYVHDTILIQDGKYHLKIIKKSLNGFIVKAMNECIIESNKNVHIPGRKLPLPSLNSKDRKVLDSIRKKDVDYIALSFCRSKKDIEYVRKVLRDDSIGIIAKIENHEGIQNIEEIIRASEGVMVARGDLGVELSPEQVPLVQKLIIRACNQEGKLVIVATQMLESMITQESPTRAEISDVANAVLDGADCVMLSAETAIGKYPLKAVQYMSKTAANVENSVVMQAYERVKGSVSDALAFSVSSICSDLPVSKILCLTVTGHTAQKIARFRIRHIPVVAITTTERVQRQLMLYYGIVPIRYVPDFDYLDIPDILIALHRTSILSRKDLVVFTAGMFTNRDKKTNILQIHRVEDVLDYRKKFTKRKK